MKGSILQQVNSFRMSRLHRVVKRGNRFGSANSFTNFAPNKILEIGEHQITVGG